MRFEMATKVGTELGDDDWVVVATLEPDQLVTARGRRFGRRKLTAGTQVVMWLLRIYAVLMLAVVVYQVVQVGHGG